MWKYPTLTVADVKSFTSSLLRKREREWERNETVAVSSNCHFPEDKLSSKVQGLCRKSYFPPGISYPQSEQKKSKCKSCCSQLLDGDCSFVSASVKDGPAANSLTDSIASFLPTNSHTCEVLIMLKGQTDTTRSLKNYQVTFSHSCLTPTYNIQF